MKYAIVLATLMITGVASMQTPEDVNSIFNILIQFPIVALFMWFYYKIQKDHKEDYKALEDKHKEDYEELAQAIKDSIQKFDSSLSKFESFLIKFEEGNKAAFKGIENETAILRGAVAEHARITELVDYIIDQSKKRQ